MRNSLVAQRYAEGKTTGSAGHMFIEGDTIYSYGSHFPIARRYIKGDRQIYVMNTRGYSATTGRHKSYVRNALANKYIVDIRDADIGKAKEQFTDNRNQMQSFGMLRSRARKPEVKQRYFNNIRDLAIQQKRLKKWFF